MCLLVVLVLLDAGLVRILPLTLGLSLLSLNSATQDMDPSIVPLSFLTCLHPLRSVLGAGIKLEQDIDLVRGLESEGSGGSGDHISLGGGVLHLGVVSQSSMRGYLLGIQKYYRAVLVSIVYG